MSIGKKIARLSKKDHRTRELSIQPPISKNQSTQVSSNQTFRYEINERVFLEYFYWFGFCYCGAVELTILQKWKEGLVNFIVESKRQLSLDARDTIKKVEQWQRQSCAMFDMVQQQILQNHDDRHESMDIAVNSNAHEKTFTKATVSGSSAKKSSTAAKKTPAIAKKPSVRTKKLKKIAKKTSVSAKAAPAAASKAFGKKPSTAAGTANKASTSSSKQKKANSSKGTAHGLTNQILPDLSSDSSSDESTENSPVSQKSSCPSMPGTSLSPIRQSYFCLLIITFFSFVDIRLFHSSSNWRNRERWQFERVYEKTNCWIDSRSREEETSKWFCSYTTINWVSNEKETYDGPQFRISDTHE